MQLINTIFRYQDDIIHHFLQFLSIDERRDLEIPPMRIVEIPKLQINKLNVSYLRDVYNSVVDEVFVWSLPLKDTFMTVWKETYHNKSVNEQFVIFRLIIDIFSDSRIRQQFFSTQWEYEDSILWHENIITVIN